MLEALGYVNSSIYGWGSTAVADSLLGIRYLYSDGSRPVPGHYRLLQTDTALAVYENPYALPLAFVGSSAALDVALPGTDEALPADVRVNGTLIGEYFTMDSLGGVMPLGTFAAGEPVSLYLGFAGDAEARAAIQIYSLDGASLSAAVNTLRSSAP